MDRVQLKTHLAARRCQQWNAVVPIGTYVRYYHLVSRDEFTVTRTRSEAWPLSSDHPVVQLEGKAGSFSLDSLEIATSEEAAEAVSP